MLETAELKLNLITAVCNSDSEEKIATLLHSQGCNIIYRALNLTQLMTYLAQSKIKTTVIYTQDFGSIFEIDELKIKFMDHNFLELSQSYNQQEILSSLASINKPALIHEIRRLKNVITVMGTPGSPGVSTVSNHLAIFMNAKIFASSHHNLRPKSEVKVLTFIPARLDEEISTLGKEILIIDSGPIVSLTKILADRRSPALWLTHSLNRANHLVYIVNSNENSLSYLSDFFTDFKNIISPPEITFIINQQRFDKNGQRHQAIFTELTKGQRSIGLPYDRSVQHYLGRPKKSHFLWRGTTFTRQIGEIGRVLL